MITLLPVIAIVGRPNVGKSTLFNRLTRSRNAVITAYPGTTRDRQYGEVRLNQRHFIVVDTGGFTDEVNPINEQINYQAKQAINDANKILFVIDGQAGVTEADIDLAKALRKTHKNIVLGVNKAEGMNLMDLTDVYRLGLGEPVPLSALHGQGMDALVEHLLPEIDQDEPREEDIAIRVALVGKPNVGKSTLINRLLGEERMIVSDVPGTTRDSITIPLQRFDQKYLLIDTAGVRKRKSRTELPEKFSVVKTLQAIEYAQVVLFLVDARTGITDQDLKLLNFVYESGKGLVIAVNKWDHLAISDKEEIKFSIKDQLHYVSYARVHYISALYGTGVGNLFDSIQEAHQSMSKDLPTSLLTKLLLEANQTHPPPLVKGRRIKLRYAHLGGRNPPRIIIHGNQLNALPQSYQRYLIHFFQRKLKLHGTPIFIEMKIGVNPFVQRKKR